MDSQNKQMNELVVSVGMDELLRGTLLYELLDAPEVCPNEATEDGDEVIGEMTSLERKSYALMAQYIKIAGGIELQIRFNTLSPEDRDLLYEGQANAAMKAKFFSKLMWALIRDRLHQELMGDWSVGVRSEFKVVRFAPRKKDPSEIVERILGKIIGGDD
jgi:hypothetical protein